MEYPKKIASNVVTYLQNLSVIPDYLRVPGYEDFVRLAIAPALMMLFPYCQLHRGHLTTDFFTANLPAVIRRSLDKFWRYVTTLLAIFLGYSMTQGMIETYYDNSLSQILSWAQWPFYLPAVISVFLWAAVAFLDKDDS